MSEALLPDDPPVTVEAFDDFLGSQEDQRAWELVAGRIVAMTNPTQRHEQIVANIGVRLKQAAARLPDLLRRHAGPAVGQPLRHRQAQARSSGAPRQAAERSCVIDPLVVVEVLSPSTMDVDRGDKLRFYKRLPTLVHVVLVCQDQVRVEHYRRIDTGWEPEVLTGMDDLLGFAALGCELRLAEAYDGAEPPA